MALPEKPITRKERYLSAMAGEETQIPEKPVTREEQYLDYIAQNGGGGGGEQIQPDWNQTDSTAKDFIKNKPTIPKRATVTDHGVIL